MGNGSRKVMVSSSFFQEKVKAQRVFKRGSHTHKVGRKKEALVPEVTSEGTVVPDPLEDTIDISVSDVWITDCIIVSSRLGESLYMLSSCISLLVGLSIRLINCCIILVYISSCSRRNLKSRRSVYIISSLQ
ncbi:hypothetical protein H5410_022670 [Solanum commersonii]|uniref:Uncharacterized protein n=1 Tax=Solanum commersonii TaxID=4109 RepID=A0A9J5ZG39_SOLCO|nr:hypothetical protein H5410_022670 [Solanum commersonii]